MDSVAKLHILGSGGHAGVIADLVVGNNLAKQVSFLDDRYPEVKVSHSINVVGRCSDYKQFMGEFSCFFVGIGDNTVRKALFEMLVESGASIAVIISPDAVISTTVDFDTGSLVMPGVVVNSRTRIGKNVIVNTGAIVEHDCFVGDHAHVAPGAVLTGGARIGAQCLVGAGAVVCPGVSLTSGVVLGAGAVATKDILLPGRYVGIPACPID